MRKSKIVPAAQYLRMSTEHQQYSFANQEAAIAKYAAQNGFRIVHTYRDSGRSGVNLRQRPALRALLEDVKLGRAPYKAVLVYDVSRWGRFQDTDEAASYEFICKKSGISLHYCTEQFANDGTPSSSMMKMLKRAMAGEYSRELSAKVYEGQRRLTLLGFKMGGTAPYGLRRLMISPDGMAKQRLRRGDRKSIQTFRVVLIPGPKAEIECVRRIFSMAARQKKSCGQIASELNRKHIRWQSGLPWSAVIVHRILTNPVYSGASVWGRTTQRIKERSRRIPRSQWVVRPRSYVPIIDQGTFERVRHLLSKRKTYPRRSENELLQNLKQLLNRKKCLNVHVINKARRMFCAETYSKRFGSLSRAYELVGYRAPSKNVKASEHHKEMSDLRRHLLTHLTALFPGMIEAKSNRSGHKLIVVIDKTIEVSLFLCREYTAVPARHRRWLLHIRDQDRNNLALVALVDFDFRHIRAFHLLRPLGNRLKVYKLLRENDPWFADGETLTSLSDLCAAARRVSLSQPNSTGLHHNALIRSPRPIATFDAKPAVESSLSSQTKEAAPAERVPVATYVRMSTDRQEYSIENQESAIARFAEQHKMEVVQRYIDAGKSGLLLSHRSGLTSLLRDILSGAATYKGILVFDVSRWGRFQDPDESAHYEFLCRSYGVPVYYCAESFSNDQSFHDSLLKALKRTMAGEFSRELSTKVFEGAKRLVQLGYRMGSSPGFGLRRLMVGADGRRKAILNAGEMKSLQTDHVVLVPGPRREVSLVRRIFKTVSKRKGCGQIARELNREGLTRNGKPWDDAYIMHLLKNPKYAGRNVWNRTTRKLGTRGEKVPPERWVVRNDAFVPIIDPRRFDRTQQRIRSSADVRWSEAELVAALKRLFAVKGRISERLLKTTPGMPHQDTFRRRFGSCRNSWQLADYRLPEKYRLSADKYSAGQQLRKEVIARILELFPTGTAVFRFAGRHRRLLRFENGLTVSILFCRMERTLAGHTRWLASPIPEERDFITLVCLLNSRANRVRHFYVLPRVDLTEPHQISRTDPWLLRGTLVPCLENLYSIVTRVDLQRRTQNQTCQSIRLATIDCSLGHASAYREK